jgi:hypothetical protein
MKVSQRRIGHVCEPQPRVPVVLAIPNFTQRAAIAICEDVLRACPYAHNPVGDLGYVDGGTIKGAVALKPYLPFGLDISAPWQIGRTLLYEKLGTGEIASFRVGRARFIPRESLLNFMRRALDEQGAGGSAA